jgi:hypothetical protein
MPDLKIPTTISASSPGSSPIYPDGWVGPPGGMGSIQFKTPGSSNWNDMHMRTAPNYTYIPGQGYVQRTHPG